MSADELKRFYKSMAKNPKLYSYDTDGNLVELNKDGSVIKTIALPDYRYPTFEELDEMEQKRMESIAIANKEFEDARRELRDIYSKLDTPDSEILRINRKVKEADIKLQAVRFPLQYIHRETSVSINEIEFEKSYEKRKYPYPFFFLEERPFILQDQYVRIGKQPIKPLISVAEAKAAAELKMSSPVILFADPETNDYGFLSLKWVVEIQFNDSMYNSAQQAIFAELAKSFNDTQNLQKIILADTPDEVIYSLADVPGDADSNETKWNDILKQLIYDVNIAKFNQYPELSARLLETKTATLGAYIPDDNLIGIGLSLDNIQSKNPINWTGQNILGKALMDIREKKRSELQQSIVQSQPIQRTKKVVSKSVSTTGEIPIQTIVQPLNTTIVEEPAIVQPPSVAIAEPSTDKTIQIGVPRPIRRKPIIATTTESTL